MFLILLFLAAYTTRRTCSYFQKRCTQTIASHLRSKYISMSFVYKLFLSLNILMSAFYKHMKSLHTEDREKMLKMLTRTRQRCVGVFMLLSSLIDPVYASDPTPWEAGYTPILRRGALFFALREHSSTVLVSHASIWLTSFSRKMLKRRTHAAQIRFFDVCFTWVITYYYVIVGVEGRRQRRNLWQGLTDWSDATKSINTSVIWSQKAFTKPPCVVTEPHLWRTQCKPCVYVHGLLYLRMFVDV